MRLAYCGYLTIATQLYVFRDDWLKHLFQVFFRNLDEGTGWLCVKLPLLANVVVYAPGV